MKMEVVIRGLYHERWTGLDYMAVPISCDRPFYDEDDLREYCCDRMGDGEVTFDDPHNEIGDDGQEMTISERPHTCRLFVPADDHVKGLPEGISFFVTYEYDPREGIYLDWERPVQFAAVVRKSEKKRRQRGESNEEHREVRIPDRDDCAGSGRKESGIDLVGV